MKTMVSKVPVSAAEYRTHHVNRVKDEYPSLRNKSKGSTFALQYAGMPMTLVKNAGFSKPEAEQIYNNYHKAYTESKEYADKKKAQACKDGYLTVAFGLRVRTPLLKQVLWGSPQIPREAEAEARTAGNALSQSYGLLNNRAAVEFWKRVWASPYRLDILPVALIHDAIYALIRNDVRVVAWANKNLIECMRWQELPELRHDTVKLGAALDIFWPSWANATTLPNEATEDQIIETCTKAKEKLLKK